MSTEITEEMSDALTEVIIGAAIEFIACSVQAYWNRSTKKHFATNLKYEASRLKDK